MKLEIADSPETKEVVRQSDLYKHWNDELAAAWKREQDYRKLAQHSVSLYEAAEKTKTPYAILYANVEVLAPALYNATPRPQVKRRFKDNDPLGFVAARTMQRLLEYSLDNGSPECPTFDELLEPTVLSGLVPGRGVVRFRYEAKIEQVRNEKAAEAAEASGTVDPGEESEGPDEHQLPVETEEGISAEGVFGSTVPWNQFRCGYALTWKDVPWIAYEAEMTKVELERNFGELGVLVEVSDREDDRKDEQEGRSNKVKGVKTAQVFEIWDKVARKVIFISPGLPDKILREVADPLKLKGFFDCPEPLLFTRRVKGMTPLPLYEYYREQAEELNQITIRIRKIISAAKVRGMYDAQVEGIDKALEAEDGTLIPAENVAALQSQGSSGLDKAIWLFPIEKIVPVLQQLYTQRQQIKQVIFEINGIADIMRGSSQASETLGAQELKNQWGTLRLKRAQKAVARFARDSLRIIAEISVNKLGIDTISQMTGLNYPRLQEKQQAQQALQAQQAQVQAQMQMAQAQGIQPSGPPPQPDPHLLQIVQSPAWEEILALLQNDLQRSYRIDIETNSTVDIEATEDKKDLSEVLQAISQFLSSIGPLVQNGSMPFDMAKSMLLAIIRRFRFGDELEEQIQGMQPPQPAQNPEMEKKAKQIQVEMDKLAKDKAAFEQHVKEQQMELAAQKKEFELEQKFAQREMQMEFDHATRQLDQSAKAHMDQIQNAHGMAQEQLNMREAAAKDSESRAQASLKDAESRAQADVSAKQQEVAKGGSDLSQQQTQLAQILQAMQESVAALHKSTSTPRVAKKQPDGSWRAAHEGA